jgi:hypothetical protein
MKPAISLLLVFISYCTAVLQNPNYKVYCVGNCGTDAVVPTVGGTVLMGGSTDVDAAFLWMIQRSQGEIIISFGII